MNTEPREFISNIVAQLVITHGELLSVQAAIERSALNMSFHESEIRNLQKLDHATQFVDAITIILRNFMHTACRDDDTQLNLEDLLKDVQLGSVQGLFTGRNAPPPAAAGEIDFF